MSGILFAIAPQNIACLPSFLPASASPTQAPRTVCVMESNVLNGTVMAYDTETVTMDFNHPLAGHHLYFSGEVADIRGANVEELAHGHVH